MRTSDEIYQRVRWDPQFDPARFVLGVNRRGAEPKRVPLPAFVPGGDIPWHRVLFIEADGELVWDRATGVDRIDATAAGRVREPRRLRAPFFTAVTPHRWDPAVGWAPAADPARPVATASASLRVLTWNTLWDRYDRERIATARRRPLLLAALAGADADVIALQEADSDLLALLLRTPWVRAGYTLGTDPAGKDVDDTGLLLLSRLPVREAGRHVLGPHKAVTAVTVLTGSGPLVVAATHLSSDHSDHGADRRRVELALLAEGLAGVEGDLALVGDFNDGDGGPEGPAAVLGLRDAWTEVHGAGDRTPTFDPGTNPLAAVSSLTGRAGRLDRVLLRPDGPRATAAVLRGDSPGPDGLHPSDHYGVQADLTFGDPDPDPKTGPETAAPGLRPRTADPGRNAEDGDDPAPRVLRTVADALPEGVVHLAGSRRMGCALPGADVDLVAALPDAIGPAEVLARIAALPGATRVRRVTGARVPGLRLHLAVPGSGGPDNTGALAVDLVLVATGPLDPAEAMARRAELGEAGAMALSAIADAEAVRAEAGTRHTAFVLLARRVKAWARAQGLDSAPFGGLPGLAWSVLAARTVREAGQLDDDALLRHFFGSWAAWDQRTPIALSSTVRTPPTDDSSLTVLTPTEPVRSCTGQVSPSTLLLLTEELYRAWEALESAAETGADRWSALLEPPPLHRRHTAWTVLTVEAADPEAFAHTLGRARGRMRALLTALAEAGAADAHAWPRPFESGPVSARFAIGLGRTPPAPARLTAIAAEWSRGLPGAVLSPQEYGAGPGVPLGCPEVLLGQPSDRFRD